MGQISEKTGGTLLGIGMANATLPAARRHRRPRRHGAPKLSAAKLFGAAGLLLTALSLVAVYLG